MTEKDQNDRERSSSQDNRKRDKRKMPEPHSVRRHDNVWVRLKPRRNDSLKFNVILRSEGSPLDSSGLSSLRMTGKDQNDKKRSE